MKYLEEFLSAESKFLCIKKNQIKETQKENYLSQYKLREFSKYDYICKINEITSKFDTDKLSKSLQLDFLEYGKDLISFRRKLYLTEDKMIKLEKIIKMKKQ